MIRDVPRGVLRLQVRPGGVPVLLFADNDAAEARCQTSGPPLHLQFGANQRFRASRMIRTTRSTQPTMIPIQMIRRAKSSSPNRRRISVMNAR